MSSIVLSNKTTTDPARPVKNMISSGSLKNDAIISIT